MQRRPRGHEDAWLWSYADLITNLLLFFVVLLTAANMSKTKMQQIAKAISGETQPESLESLKEQIEKSITEKNLKEVFRTQLKDEGLELMVNSGFAFDSGRAELKPEFEAPLQAMLEEIKPFAGKYQFAVEGHTDSTALLPSSQFRSNWELSASRAIVVRGRLEGVGVEPQRIRVEGYADTRPLPEAELVGLSPEEKNARLRRVVVRVY